MPKLTIAAVVCFFFAPLLLLGAGLSSHWLDAGNHGVSRYFGPRSATLCNSGSCRSFRYDAEIRRLEALKATLRKETLSFDDYARRRSAVLRALHLAQTQNLRGWDLTVLLVLTGLIYATLGGLLLGLRRRPAWALRLPGITRAIACGTAVALGLLSWVLTERFAKGVAWESRFITFGYAFYLGQLALVLGAVGGLLAGHASSARALLTAANHEQPEQEQEHQGRR